MGIAAAAGALLCGVLGVVAVRDPAFQRSEADLESKSKASSPPNIIHVSVLCFRLFFM